MQQTTTNSAAWPETRRRADDVGSVVSETAVIVIARRGCCMGHVARRLLFSLGVNPPLYEVDEQDEASVAERLKSVSGGRKLQFPAVFIGGRWFGGLDRIMTTHLTGELTPLLKQAGALWL